jgi:hypothetical protein
VYVCVCVYVYICVHCVMHITCSGRTYDFFFLSFFFLSFFFFDFFSFFGLDSSAPAPEPVTVGMISFNTFFNSSSSDSESELDVDDTSAAY